MGDKKEDTVWDTGRSSLTLSGSLFRVRIGGHRDNLYQLVLFF